MTYSTKDECYEDVFMCLTTGILQVEDLSVLRTFYEEIEHYECCQGIAEAYKDYENIRRITEGEEDSQQN